MDAFQSNAYFLWRGLIIV